MAQFDIPTLVNLYIADEIRLQSKQNLALGKIQTTIAQYNHLLVEQMVESNVLQRESNYINSAIAEQAIQTNQKLNSISDDLNKLGYAFEHGFHRLEKSINEQTHLHREHYNQLERENILKEILYNTKKYHESFNSSDDSLAKAYGSILLLRTIDEHNFSTKDLTSFKDKEYFDTVITACQKSWDSISDENKSEIDDLEKLYYTALELLEFDIHEYAIETYPTIEPDFTGMENSPEPPYKKIDPPPLIQKFKFDGDMDAVKKITRKLLRGKLFLWLSPIAAFAIWIISWIGLFITDAAYGSDTDDIPLLLQIFILFMIAVFPVLFAGSYIFAIISFASNKLKFRKLTGIPDGKFKQALKEQQAYDSKFASVQSENQKMKNFWEKEKAKNQSRIKDEQAWADLKNQEHSEKRTELIEAHKTLFHEFRDQVNSWLEQHASIQEFLPQI